MTFLVETRVNSGVATLSMPKYRVMAETRSEVACDGHVTGVVGDKVADNPTLRDVGMIHR